MHYSATTGNPIAGPAGACPTMQRIKGNYYLTSAETGRSCPAHRRCRCAWVGVGRRACSGHGTSQPTSRSEHRSLGTPTWSTPSHSAQTGRLSGPVGSPYGDKVNDSLLGLRQGACGAARPPILRSCDRACRASQASSNLVGFDRGADGAGRARRAPARNIPRSRDTSRRPLRDVPGQCGLDGAHVPRGAEIDAVSLRWR